jgi:hypothetical protein
VKRRIEYITKALFEPDLPESSGEIVLFKIIEAYIVYRVFIYAIAWSQYIQGIGDVVLPLGVARYVDVSFMFENNVSLWVGALTCILVVVGYLRLWRWSYSGAFVLLHLLYVSRFCLGEISHGSNFIGFAILGLAIGGVAFASGTARRRFVLGYMFFFFGLGYTSAALCKLVASGPLWVDGNHLMLWIHERAVDIYARTGVLSYNAAQGAILASRPLGTAILTFGLIAETLAFLFWFRRWRWIVAILILCMHLGIWLTMRITFSSNFYLILLIGLPWHRLLDSLTGLVTLPGGVKSLLLRIT